MFALSSIKLYALRGTLLGLSSTMLKSSYGYILSQRRERCQAIEINFLTLVQKVYRAILFVKKEKSLLDNFFLHLRGKKMYEQIVINLINATSAKSTCKNCAGKRTP